MSLDTALDNAGHFAVERRQNLIEHLDESDVEPAMDGSGANFGKGTYCS